MSTEDPLRRGRAGAPPRAPGGRAQLSTGMNADELSFRELVQNANTIVLRWDLQGRITFLNDFGLELFAPDWRFTNRT